MTQQCLVLRCSNEAVVPRTLREQQEWADRAIDVGICLDHADVLDDPEAEWLYETTRDPVTDATEECLYVGPDLQGLGEYVVAPEPRSLTVYAPTSRVYSHPEVHDGYHLTLRVRRRGEERSDDLTLVIPFDELAGLVETLRLVLPTDGG